MSVFGLIMNIGSLYCSDACLCISFWRFNSRMNFIILSTRRNLAQLFFLLPHFLTPFLHLRMSWGQVGCDKGGDKEGACKTSGETEEADGEAAAVFISQVWGEVRHVGATADHGRGDGEETGEKETGSWTKCSSQPWWLWIRECIEREPMRSPTMSDIVGQFVMNNRLVPRSFLYGRGKKGEGIGRKGLGE